VAVSGASGAAINVVTKSGTNEFDGSVYYAYQDDDFIGDEFDGGEFNAGNFEEEEYGFTIGGPIVKDKLFFFVSYDEYDRTRAIDFSQDDAENGVDPEFFDVIRQAIIDTYGYDTLGRPEVANVPSESERLLIKADWNISLDHRASFTYQSTEELDVSVDSEEFESAWYDIPLDLESYTVQLNSDWTPRLSTEFRANYKEFSRGQVCRGGPDVGEISINFFDPDANIGTPAEGLLSRGAGFDAGCDEFRHANEFSDERLQLFALGEYFLGDHVISFGAELENYQVRNLFISNSRGDFEFRSYNDLINQFADEVEYQNVPSNNARDGVTQWEYDKWSFFVGDSWAITPDFSMDFGLRYEVFDQSDRAPFSQAVLDTYGFRTDTNLDGNDLLMPRVSFLWTPLERTSISGGIGLFPNSAPPQVWISNAFNPPQGFADVENRANANPLEVPPELIDEVATQTPLPLDAISPDFDTPSDWKASLRAEQVFDLAFGNLDLGRNYIASAQFVYTKARDGFVWENIAQTQLAETQPLGTAPDGRPIYADLEALDIPNLTVLDNTDGAESKTITLALAKQYDNGLSFDVSYAWQDAEIVSEGTSSRGISNWRGIVDTDRNNPSARTSPFEIEHSFKFNFGFERNFIADLQTRVDVFGRVFRGETWTATFSYFGTPDDSLFGRARAEAPFSNSPLYIPSPGGDDLVVYGSGFDVEGFFEYVEDNDLPVGQIHDPFSASVDDWNNIWDLRFQQELPGIPGLGRFVGDNNFKLILDIENFPNLLNSDWGKVVGGPSFGQAGIVEADLVSREDVAANGVDGATRLDGDSMREACQSASDCVYRFNFFAGRFAPSERADFDDSVYEIRLTLRYDF
jgi:hypothetical protein